MRTLLAFAALAAILAPRAAGTAHASGYDDWDVSVPQHVQAFALPTDGREATYVIIPDTATCVTFEEVDHYSVVVFSYDPDLPCPTPR